MKHIHRADTAHAVFSRKGGLEVPGASVEQPQPVAIAGENAAAGLSKCVDAPVLYVAAGDGIVPHAHAVEAVHAQAVAQPHVARGVAQHAAHRHVEQLPERRHIAEIGAPLAAQSGKRDGTGNAERH